MCPPWFTMVSCTSGIHRSPPMIPSSTFSFPLKAGRTICAELAWRLCLACWRARWQRRCWSAGTKRLGSRTTWDSALAVELSSAEERSRRGDMMRGRRAENYWQVYSQKLEGDYQTAITVLSHLKYKINEIRGVIKYPSFGFRPLNYTIQPKSTAWTRL